MAEFVAAGRSVPLENGWSWIAQGWELFKRQAGMWIVLVLVLIVVMIVLTLVPVLGWIAQFVLTPVITGGLLVAARAVDQGEKLEVGHLLAGFREHFGSLLAIGVSYFIAVLVIAFFSGLVSGVSIFGLLSSDAPDPAALAAMALSVLLAILIMLALLVPVLMAIWFAPALVMFHQLDALAAMKASFVGCLKNILPFLLYGAVLFVLSILASIPFGLGWLVLLPVVMTSYYASYRDLYFR
jgi:uncharacterized membrane protein